MTALTIRRRQEVELPATIEVSFVNKTIDYQRGLQRGIRNSTMSSLKTPLSVPIVLDDTAARDIAERLLYNAWMERTLFTFRTTVKYAWLEPTDVIQVKEAVSGTIHTMRIVTKTESRNGEIDFECVAEHYRLYAQRPTTGASAGGGGAVAPKAGTRTFLMDLPVLRETDTTFGFYLGQNGDSADGVWRGGVLLESSDGITYTQVGSTSAPVFSGLATNSLGNWANPSAFFDEANKLNVMPDDGVTGTLSSATRKQVLSGANLVAVESVNGWELLNFRTATLETDGSYTLTGLLRGRYGTEWAMPGHVTGGRVVLIGSAVGFVTQPTSELNLSRQWKGVTNGELASGVTPISFTNSGVALKPYSPVHIGGGRDDSSNVLMQWKRRTRIGGAWVDFTDVPLSEASELYEIEIWNSSYTTLKRTITGVTTHSYTYTAADQTTDFGSPQATVYVKVFQISATRGRGFEGKGTI